VSKQIIRAVGYIRVSDESQVDGYSLEAQRKAIIRYCEQQGYSMVRVYEDEGVSAYSDLSGSRPQLLNS
jgi:site-specific DNA recombinase